MRPENLLLLILLGVLVFMMFSRTRRQQREAQQVQAGLAPGAEVMTGSGLFATVISVEDQVVVLETAPGQRSRWDRRAVARIIAPVPAEPSPPEPRGTAEEDEAEPSVTDQQTPPDRG